MNQTSSSRAVFTRQVLIAIGIAAVVLVLLWSSWYFANVLLLTFAGVLLAVFLRGIAEWLSARLPIPIGLSLTLVVLALIAAFGLVLLLFGPTISRGFDELAQALPQALEQLEDTIKQHRFLNNAFERALQDGPSTLLTPTTFNRVAGIFSTVLGALTGLLIILVNGLYFSVEPGVYVNGMVRLVPIDRRGRAREVLAELGHVLRWWLIGRLVSMTLVGIMTGLGIWLLGLPGAAALGFLAGLLSFVPNIGPVIAAVPAVLVGLMQGPQMALYVVLLYAGIQTVESYFITPLVQRRAVSLPPALILAVQIAMGLALGVLGVLLATPLALVVLVLVQMLYVNDVLGDDVQPP